MTAFERTTTKHGIPLYVFPMPYVESVALGVLVFAGTRDETWPKQAGIAHALEHMLFQGNKRLPNQHAIAAEIEDVGGVVNAWTNNEVTMYYRVMPRTALGIAVDSLASQLTTPLFRDENIKLEMMNIVQEIGMCHDDPGVFCQMQFEETVFGQHPLGKNTLGTAESVSNFSPDDFGEFHGAHYRPANYVFIVVGNTTLGEAEIACNERSFGTSINGGRNIRSYEKGIVNGKSRICERENI
ncbi:MAG: insulinase family protein, partial [Anaerolineae bacterium]|nr:insulinase family protein [Anaerolineae bacterium]